MRFDIEPYSQHIDRMSKRPESHRLKSHMEVTKASPKNFYQQRRTSSGSRERSLERMIAEKRAAAMKLEA